MNNGSDELFDPRIAEWLEDGPDRAPSLVLATLDNALPSIPQRHSWRVFWRSPSMSLPKLIGIAAAAALVVVVGLGAIGLLTGRGLFLGGNAATPSPLVTQSPQPLPTAAPTTAAPTTAVATVAATSVATPIPTSTPAATPATLSAADVGRG